MRQSSRSGQRLPGLYLIRSGAVDLITPENNLLLHLNVGNCFGERAMLGNGEAPNSAVASQDSTIYVIPKAEFKRLIQLYPAFHAYFDSSLVKKSTRAQIGDTTASLIAITIGELMTRSPISVSPDIPVTEAARIMGENKISCILVTEQDQLVGILTSGDLAHRVVAASRPPRHAGSRRHDGRSLHIGPGRPRL